MVIENFSTYTEVDESNDVTVTATKCDVTVMIRGTEMHVTDDKGAGHYEDYEHLLEVSMNISDTRGHVGFWGLSNGAFTHTTMQAANAGVGVYGYGGADNIYLFDYSNDGSDTSNRSPDTLYYLTIVRVDTLYTVEIYDDADRTNLVDTLSETGVSTAFRYQIAAWSREDSGTYSTEEATGFCQNLDIQEAAPAAAPLDRSYSAII